ncbi:MAG: CDGSH iron-sulfur domain-containing protein [Acidobacteria bacterium]|nr:CDGSH iron-sulfur domain-containing protein [Acidobacteriota bacterium]
MSADKPPKPTITPAENGPYVVKGLENLRNSRGGKLPTEEVFALCRCGGSANKPYCDGAHSKIGFSDAQLEGRVEDKRESFAVAEVTVHDNRGICSHAGVCTDGLPKVFRLGKEPWIDPNGASAGQIIATVKKCPSGALSYSIGGVEQRDQDREPTITVAKDGPYVVTGRPNFAGVGWAEGASQEHYTLCRCGASKNKPFCDGTHWSIKFSDEKN